MFLKNTVFSLHRGFPQATLLLGILQVFYFWGLWDHRFLKMFANFFVLLRNWPLSLSLKMSKVASVIIFPVWFHLILFLSLIKCIINQLPLLIALILITEFEELFIYKYMVFSYARFFPRNLVHKFSMGKKFHSLYPFELMIHFLAKESFLNMHSDFLLSLIPGVWMV